MNDAEAHSILSLHRAGEESAEDARLQEALRKAEGDPALAQWWKAEQELDRIIAGKLQAVHLPAGLKTRIASVAPVRPQVIRTGWSRAILAAAAAIAVLAVFFSSWRGPFQPAASLADYRNEMVSFIKVPPTLELQSADMRQLNDFLSKAEAPAHFPLPEKLKAMQPVGCRILRFRGHDVSLVCFKSVGDRLVHLFVIDAKTLPASGTAPAFAPEADWMTATWSANGEVYLLSVQGTRADAENFFEAVGQ